MSPSVLHACVLCCARCCRFIFITGWSVWAQTMLKRTPTQDFDSPSIGDMLIKKAEQGVNVSGASTAAAGSRQSSTHA